MQSCFDKEVRFEYCTVICFRRLKTGGEACEGKKEEKKSLTDFHSFVSHILGLGLRAKKLGLALLQEGFA